MNNAYDGIIKVQIIITRIKANIVKGAGLGPVCKLRQLVDPLNWTFSAPRRGSLAGLLVVSDMLLSLYFNLIVPRCQVHSLSSSRTPSIRSSRSLTTTSPLRVQEHSVLSSWYRRQMALTTTTRHYWFTSSTRTGWSRWQSIVRRRISQHQTHTVAALVYSFRQESIEIVFITLFLSDMF